MKRALTLAVLLAVTTLAQAGWVQTGPNTALVDGRIEVQIIPMGQRTSPLGTSLDTYQVNLNALDPNDAISAVEVQFRPAPGQQGCGLYQIGWYTPPPPIPITTYTPDRNMSQYLANELCDSHFLMPDDPNLWAGYWSDGNANPSEDNDLSYGINGSGEYEGLGTFLQVTAFLTPIRNPLPLAHIAVPAGCKAEFAGEISNATGSFFSFLDPAIPIPIPEPATVGLLVLGGLGVLSRKRRR